MEWIQFIMFMIAIGGIFFWLRADIATNRTEAAADRRDILTLIREIKDELKDLHGILCSIEERNKKG